MNDKLFLFMVDVGVNSHGGPLYGTEYALDEACKRCGTGALQTGPLLMRPFKPPKSDMFYPLSRELLVSTQLAEVLEGAGFHRCVRPVLDAKSREPLAVMQLKPEATLPSFLPESEGVTRERPCPACDRDGYFGIAHVPMVLKYRRLGPVAADLFSTYERFGNSRLRSPFKDSVLAAPMYVGSARLVDVLRAHKVRGLEFEPVRLGER